jgi:DNA replication and repair protein RecF
MGVTLVGPHREDWILTYKGKNLNKYGSRGEKRMAITDIAFKMNQLLIEIYKEKPVILLDDISSELDKKNIKRLLKEKVLPGQQTIITTTEIKNISEFINQEYQTIKL